MGLFGVIASIVTGGTLIASKTSDTTFNNKSKAQSIKDNDLTWTDSHGKIYMVSTGERVYLHSGKLKSVSTGRVVYDFDKENAQKINKENILKAEKDNKKYARLIFPEFDNRYYYVELSTMKRYYLTGFKLSKRNYSRYVKHYYAPGQATARIGETGPQEIESEISQEEFISLGGFVTPYNDKVCDVGKYY